MATTVYLVVSGRGTTMAVERYFYGHTRWESASTDLDDYGYTANVLAITADGAAEADTLADMQADRLRSGLYGVLTVSTLREANEQLKVCYTDVVARVEADRSIF